MKEVALRLLPSLFSLFGLWSAVAGAQPGAAIPAPAPAPAAAPATVARDADPALWVVKDADTTIYLFGTIHVLQPGLSWFDEAVKAAFDRSDELKLEMVLPEQGAAQATMMKAGVAASGPTLPERLPPAARPTYFARIAELGLPATALDRFQPWFAANNLVVLPLMKLGYAPDSGAERVLTGAAAAAGKPVTGFETLEEQLGFFTGLSEEAQVAYLTGVLDELPQLKTSVEAMVGEWSRGDPVALARLLNDDLAANPELAKRLLADRNARWAGQLAERMGRPGTVFVAVGAGHLAGGDSVQAMLAKRGFKVERVAY